MSAEALQPVFADPAVVPDVQPNDDALTRYVFSPFRGVNVGVLDRTAGLDRGLASGRLQEIRTIQYADNNAQRVNISDQVPASAIRNQPEFVMKTRLAGEIMRDLTRFFNPESDGEVLPCGFCEVEPLRGIESRELIADLQTFWLPRRFEDGLAMRDWIAGHQQELVEMVEDLGDVYPTFEAVGNVLLASVEEAIAWCHDHRLRTIASMESFAAGHGGKSTPSSLNIAACRWVQQPVPKTASKISDGTSGGPAPVPTVIVQAPAPVPGPETQQCPLCFNPVPTRNGEMPNVCTHCNGNPREAAAAEKPKKQTKKAS